MEEKNKKLWFRAKSFGWGWVPISWEEGTGIFKKTIRPEKEYREKSNQEQRKDNN